MRHHQQGPLEFATTPRDQARLGTVVAVAAIAFGWFIIGVIVVGLILPAWYTSGGAGGP